MCCIFIFPSLEGSAAYCQIRLRQERKSSRLPSKVHFKEKKKYIIYRNYSHAAHCVEIRINTKLQCLVKKKTLLLYHAPTVEICLYNTIKVEQSTKQCHLLTRSGVTVIAESLLAKLLQNVLSQGVRQVVLRVRRAQNPSSVPLQSPIQVVTSLLVFCPVS